MVNSGVHSASAQYKQHTPESVRELLTSVCDPEIPVLSVVDLGIIRSISVEDTVITVSITPTYSGCPAMQMIEDEIRIALQQSGPYTVNVRTVFAPAWTTDWLSEDAKKKILEYGIAPPVSQSPLLQIDVSKIPCPQCGSTDTSEKSHFGSTACKSFFVCRTCRQPFEYFKTF